MSSQRTRLSVNLNKVALLRNARPLSIPRLDEAARIVLYETDASGITIHPRPDQRHIRYDDVTQISKCVRDFNAHNAQDSHDSKPATSATPAKPATPSTPATQRRRKKKLKKELNIEGNPFHEKFLEIVHQACPHQCTLVPDDSNQQTSDHGWSDPKSFSLLEPIVRKLRKTGIRISLFMDPDPEMIREAIFLEPDAIELYTEPYANQFSQPALREPTLNLYRESAALIADKKILLNAGHDLNLQNLSLFLDAIPNIHEVSIGHALIADSIFYGLKTTIDKFQDIIDAKYINKST